MFVKYTYLGNLQHSSKYYVKSINENMVTYTGGCIMKVIIAFRGNEIPVYLEKAQHKKAVHKLAEILQQKLLHSKRLVRKFLDSLDSIEIIGGDVILFSKNR